MEKKEKIESIIELLPCPFCGSKAYTGIGHFDLYWTIGCTKCPCDFQRRFETKEIAIEFWNSRKEIEK